MAALFTVNAYADTTHNATHRFKKDLHVHGEGARGRLVISSNTVTDDTDSGAGTQVLTGVIPAGVTCVQISCHVDVVIVGAGASTFDLGDGTDADLYGAAIAFAAGTTVTHADYTAAVTTNAWSATADDLTMTADAGQFDTGTISCTCHYLSTAVN